MSQNPINPFLKQPHLNQTADGTVQGQSQEGQATPPSVNAQPAQSPFQAQQPPQTPPQAPPQQPVMTQQPAAGASPFAQPPAQQVPPQTPQQQMPAQPVAGASPFIQSPAQQVPPQTPPQAQAQPQQPMQPTQQQPQQPQAHQAPQQIQAMKPAYGAVQAGSSSQPQPPSPFDFASANGGNQQNSEQAASQNGRPRFVKLAFTGGVAEYYGITIFNYLLTIITLGIWAPWAKVRKLRYFYGHTELLDEEFAFLATGKQLFIGRIVAFIILIGLALFELVPYVGPVLGVLVIILGVPFVINRSIGFTARHIAWRDVRFNWHGTFGGAFVVLILWPFVSLITLGLAQPLSARAMRRFFADNHAFGEAEFSADLPLGAFYGALLKSVTFFLFLTILFSAGLGVISYAVLAESVIADASSYSEILLLYGLLDETQQGALFLPLFGVILASYMAGSYYMALTRHIMVDLLRLAGGIRFRSSLSAFRFAMIIFTNLLLNIITLGFAQPYTAVRRYRYLVTSIEVRPIADMRGFIDHQQKSSSSIFEEASDIEGLSIDI